MSCIISLLTCKKRLLWGWGMSFSLDYDISDLFVSDDNNEKVFKVNRLKVREIALKTNNYIKDVEATGGNKHAAELDTRDAVVGLLTKIGLSEYNSMVELFNSVLLEETTAIAMLEFDKQQIDFENKIKQIEDDAKNSASMTTVVSWVVAAVAVLLFAVVLLSR